MNMPDDIARHELERIEEASEEYIELSEQLEVLKKQASKLEVELADERFELNVKEKNLTDIETKITRLEHIIENYGTAKLDEDGF